MGPLIAVIDESGYEFCRINQQGHIIIYGQQVASALSILLRSPLHLQRHYSGIRSMQSTNYYSLTREENTEGIGNLRSITNINSELHYLYKLQRQQPPKKQSIETHSSHPSKHLNMHQETSIFPGHLLHLGCVSPCFPVYILGRVPFCGLGAVATSRFLLCKCYE